MLTLRANTVRGWSPVYPERGGAGGRERRISGGTATLSERENLSQIRSQIVPIRIRRLNERHFSSAIPTLDLTLPQYCASTKRKRLKPYQSVQYVARGKPVLERALAMLPHSLYQVGRRTGIQRVALVGHQIRKRARFERTHSEKNSGVLVSRTINPTV